jgi:hypothetical protein
MSSILTHERIKLDSGVLTAAKGILWGGNALQSITLGRHTPKNPQQAVGFLGIVDYTSGTITSDAQLDTVLVEGCNKAGADLAQKGASIYRYAGKQATAGAESYCLTSCGVAFGANAPATANYGWITSGLATYLDTQNQPDPSDGEESQFCVVMADDGSGVALKATWEGTAPTAVNNLPILDASGTIVPTSDQGIPGGVQSVSFSSSINRDQILDIRATSPVQWVTTYPLDLRMDMETHVLPVSGATPARPGDALYNPSTFRHAMRSLKTLWVEATGLNKHVTGGATKATSGDIYVKAIGIQQVDESEGLSVGRYLTYNFNFILADLLVPLPSLYVAP